ncbi:MAG: hypothetical protein J3R72DRAFT_173573 [Linnemannia gamsii]|nr:MAG: hypothetical protein J3R72DRAFT_173573 [Linnemannia gamsii]
MSSLHSSPSSDSTRPLNLANLILAEHRKNNSENLAELESQQEALAAPTTTTTATNDDINNDGDVVDLNSVATSNLEPGQTQKSLGGLASVVGRVRLAQKQGTFVQTDFPAAADQTSSQEQGQGQEQGGGGDQKPQEQGEHWYSTFLPKHLHFHRHHQDDSEVTSTAAPSQPAVEEAPPKELSTIDHAAGAFASASRANNLETIDFTVESLGVTGAAAPAFLLRTDEKGRRPVS